MVTSLDPARAWAVLAAVPDPEVPAISIVDLGIVRDVVCADGGVHVTVTPTYAGCPATEVIAQDITRALENAGAARVTITTRLSPAWTTDWLSAAARAKLLAYGIAPPAKVNAGSESICRRACRAAEQAGKVIATPACPRCGSAQTEQLSAFGATACKALYRCTDCREPFEYFKPH